MSGTLIVGDVHGCAAELSALIACSEAEQIVFVGDLFTKGPDPAGVWSIIKRLGATAVLGNHDAAVLETWPRDSSPIPREAFDWLGARPLFLEGIGLSGPYIVVHAGLDPEGGIGATGREAALNLRRWPSGGERSENQFWWELYTGTALVIYGHDARRGLRDHRPHTLGLDTGCVYGGQLTGYLVEQDLLFSVPAASAYHPVR